METLLTTCGFPQLIDIFNENDIKENNLCDLTPDLLKELIAKVGLRMEFSKALDIYKAKFTFFDGPSTSTGITLLNSENVSFSNDTISVSSVEEKTIHDEFMNKHFYMKQSALMNLLKSTSHGKSLLLKYSKNGFCRKDRNVLVDIVISNELKEEPDSRLLSRKLNAEGIELFTNEKKGIID